MAWQHRIVCQSFIAGTPFEAAIIKDGVDHTAVEGAAELPYDIPNLLVDWKRAPDGVPTLWWRSVGHSHTAFVVESFVDELAHAAGKDPLEFRRALLGKHPRYKAVLELAADKAGWGKPLPEGHGRGLAVHESFGSFVAEVAEVSVARDGQLKVHRVVCAVDCGPIVNPDTIQAQMESAVVFGLTAALIRRDHLGKRARATAQFPRLPDAADERNAGGRDAHHAQHREDGRHRRDRRATDRPGRGQRRVRGHGQTHPASADPC